MRRCCEPIEREFDPCYASVLLFGTGDGLSNAVAETEESKIASCFTAWCDRCCRLYLLANEVDDFPTPSAHHAHKIAQLRRLRELRVL